MTQQIDLLVNRIQRMANEAKTNPLKRSVLINVAMKPMGLIISLVSLPLMLHYLTAEQYGVWITVLSVVNWISFFDVGIGNGFRNILTENIAKEDFKGARSSVATAYISVTCIVCSVFLVIIFFGRFVDWKKIFNTNIDVLPVLLTSFFFVCVNFILGLRNMESFAIQKSEHVAVSSVVTQLINLIGVGCLFYGGICNNKLLYLSCLMGFSGLIVNVVVSGYLWRKKEYLKPILSAFDKSKLKAITSQGIKFFLLQICALIVFTTNNLLISHYFSPAELVPYNTVYKVYNIANMLFIAILTPMWSKFTEAKAKKDYAWIRVTVQKLKFIWGVFSVCMLLSLFFVKHLLFFWLRKELNYGNILIPVMVGYFIVVMYSQIYAYLLNGLNEVMIEIGLAIFNAVLQIPLAIWLSVTIGFGPAGVCLASLLLYVVIDIIFTMYFRNNAFLKYDV